MPVHRLLTWLAVSHGQVKSSNILGKLQTDMNLAARCLSYVCVSVCTRSQRSALGTAPQVVSILLSLTLQPWDYRCASPLLYFIVLFLNTYLGVKLKPSYLHGLRLSPQTLD